MTYGQCKIFERPTIIGRIKDLFRAIRPKTGWVVVSEVSDLSKYDQHEEEM